MINVCPSNACVRLYQAVEKAAYLPLQETEKQVRTYIFFSSVTPIIKRHLIIL